MRDAFSTFQTSSVPKYYGLDSGKLANIVHFKGFELALASVLITSAVFYAETLFGEMIHFMYFFTQSLPMLKCTRKSVVFIAFIRWTRNARLISNATFDAAPSKEKGSMVGLYRREKRKKEGKK